MPIPPSAPMPIMPAATPPAHEARQLEQAATAFEAMMLERFLATGRMKKKTNDWRAIADRQFAEQLATTRPLGVGQMIRNMNDQHMNDQHMNNQHTSNTQTDNRATPMANRMDDQQ